ncbi:Hypothetical protein FKW44_007219, partial [Caligus rogercresseyi]
DSRKPTPIKFFTSSCAVQSHISLKLPEFNYEDPGEVVYIAESKFNISRITDDKTKVNQ